MFYVDEGIKGKLLPRFQLRALKALIEDEMFDDTSSKWAESAAEDLEKHQEKKTISESLKLKRKEKYRKQNQPTLIFHSQWKRNIFNKFILINHLLHKPLHNWQHERQ